MRSEVWAVVAAVVLGLLCWATSTDAPGTYDDSGTVSCYDRMTYDC